VKVADDAAGKNAHEIVVEPIRDDYALRYRAWVTSRAARIAEATGGRCGYLHIPDMGPAGGIEFHRAYFWQVLEKKGFIVDARYNGGGNISSILLEKLMRKPLGWDRSRHGVARSYPYHSPMGPIVILTNECAGSDGDIFTQAVKEVNLGPVIGTRTWGGTVGIDTAKDLVDGGMTTQPEYAHWFNGTKWAVENGGVAPDIEVQIDPGQWMRGEDPQLERAIAEWKARAEKAPDLPPDLGPVPNFGFKPPGA
jgi:tricorn protease